MNNQVEDTVIEIIRIIQERITFSESKVKEDTVENRNLNSFWEGQVRCAQVLMNKINDRWPK